MRTHKDWLRAYVEFNQFNETPDHFHFWVGVSVIAGALRRKVWVDMGYFQWTPNFYIILVAPPGIVGKSTSLGIGQSILSEVEGIHFGPAAMTWQALIPELASHKEAVTLPNGSLLSMSCLSFFISELGTCVDFTDRKMIDVLVDLWDGRAGEWAKSTATRGREGIENPWINVIACTTPTWLADNLPKNTVMGGFSSRCIWLFANEKKRLVPYPKLMLEASDMRTREGLVRDLRQIAELVGEFTLTKEAYEVGIEWYKRNAERLSRSTNDAMSGYVARMQTHIHKLAMVLSASRRSDMQITARDLADSIKIIESLEQSISPITRSIDSTSVMQVAQEITSIVHAKGRIRRSELYQMFFHRLTAKEFSELLESAIAAGEIYQATSGITVWVCSCRAPAFGGQTSDSASAGEGQAP